MLRIFKFVSLSKIFLLLVLSFNVIAADDNNDVPFDPIPPVITPPSDIIVESTAKFTPVNIGMASAIDNIDGVLPVSPDITGPFEVAVHYITWTATDSSGNDGIAIQKVTVQDTTPPVITVPADITVVSDIPIEIKIGKATATDISAVNISNNEPTFFPVGTTIVTWTAIDDFFNSSTAIQVITVSSSTTTTDTTAPVVTAPAAIILEATAINTPVILGAATATDNIDITLTVTNDAPTAFPLGLTTVTWSATDVAGNIGTATQIITITDTTAPSLIVPASLTVESAIPLVVTIGTATASDLFGPVSISNDAPALFPLGLTTVTWTAIDVNNNSASLTQTVTVTAPVGDTIAPIVTAPAAIVFEATAINTPIILGAATATDNVDASLTITNDAPTAFPLGLTTVTWKATDTAGNIGTASQTITITDTTAPIITAPTAVTFTTLDGTAVIGDIGNATATDIFTPVTINNDAPGAFSLGSTTVTWTATDASGNSATALQRVTVVQQAANAQPEGSFGSPYNSQIPADATAVYNPKRFSIITGFVNELNGQPIVGAVASIHDHPEYGTAKTDMTGRYSLPVDGGKIFTVDLITTGYLNVQRKIKTEWNQIYNVSTVVLLPVDTKSTTVSFDGNPATKIVHSSTPITDVDGTRATTLVFSGDTSAVVNNTDGTVTTLTNPLTVRATEFVRPDTMPGDLPPTSAFTYCADLTVDGIDPMASVQFTKPIIMYVDNFLNYPIGEIVPVGYYDRTTSKWVPNKNGIVITLLDTNTDGIVDALDSTGDGLPNDLNSDGSTLDEVAGITGNSAYQPGSSYWRAEILHFTPWDHNWPFRLPSDTSGPSQSPPTIDDKQDCENTASTGSTVSCESRQFSEDVDVIGTDFDLHYQSNKTSGYVKNITIPVTRDTLSVSLISIKTEVTIAGRKFSFDVPVLPNQQVIVNWDGNDYLGNRILGITTASVKITFEYPLVYASAPLGNTQGISTGMAFARFGSGRSLGIRSSQTVKVSSSYKINISTENSTIAQGWSISSHHHIENTILVRGDGQQTAASKSTLVGNGAVIDTIFDGTARGSSMYVNSIAFAPDGSYYFIDNALIKRVDPVGNVITIAGNGTRTSSGDGGPALLAGMNPYDIVLSSSGILYFTERSNYRIRKISVDGIVSLVAGTGSLGSSGDNGLATQATLNLPSGIDIGPDGSLYFADWNNGLIRRIDTNGIISSVAGNSRLCSSTTNYGDGGLATQATLCQPETITFSPDGSMFILEGSKIRKVSPDGIISTIAGDVPFTNTMTGDGGPALLSSISAFDIIFAPNGDLFIASHYQRIRRITLDGIISTYAGKDGSILYPPTDNESVAVNQIPLFAVGIAFAPDNSLYLAAQKRIQKIYATNSFELSTGEKYIPEPLFNEAYVFSSSNKHLRTLDLNTGVVLKTFGYDFNGNINTITDRFGAVTQILYSGTLPTTIIGADGHTTQLAIINDQLMTITRPDLTTYDFSYSLNGLLTSKTDPNGGVFDYTYDLDGRITKTQDAVGGITNFSSTTVGGLSQSTTTDQMGRNYSTLRSKSYSGIFSLTKTNKAGLDTTTTTSSDSLSSSISQPDGTILDLVFDVNSQYKTQKIAKSTATFPSGLTSNQQRRIAYNDNNNDGNIDVIINSVTTNNLVTTISNDINTGTQTFSTPTGRNLISTYNVQTLLPNQLTIPGLAPTNYAFDTRGRLTQVSVGSGTTVRDTNITWDVNGNIGSVTDAVNRATSYNYDSMDRVIQQTLPDGHIVDYSYDANGNLASITPPGSATHLFNYDAVSLPSKYTPPALGTTPIATTYNYNLAKQLTNITRPDNQTVALAYDTGARLSTITIPRGIYKFDYDIVTGNLATLTSPDTSTISYIYDGSLITEEKSTGTVNGSVARIFDNNYRTTSRSVNGTSIAYSYDNDSLLTGVGSESLVRDSLNGLLIGTTLDTITTTRTYNTFGEPQSVSASSGTTSLYNTSYTRDSVGRITSKVETIQGVSKTYTYGYDLTGRLITVDENGIQVSSYSYDSNGNRLTHNTINGSYDAQDRLLTYGTASYTYTSNGELLTKTENNVTTNYQYDVLGNLLKVTLPGVTTIDYVIDARNRRVGKKVNGTLTQGFLYKDQLNPIAELDGAGAVVSRFVYGSKINVPDYMIKGGVTYRIISDHLGSPRLIVDSSNGNIVQRIDYDEFGTIINDTNPGFQPFGFAGGLYDTHTRFTKFGYRDYDSKIGRWVSKDPIGFSGGLNLYNYVINDPINFVDFEGTIVINVGAAVVGLAIGAGIGAINAYLSGGSLLSGAAQGAITGLTAGFSLGTSLLVSGAVSASVESARQWATGECFSSTKAGIAFISGAIGKGAVNLTNSTRAANTISRTKQYGLGDATNLNKVAAAAVSKSAGGAANVVVTASGGGFVAGGY